MKRKLHWSLALAVFVASLPLTGSYMLPAQEPGTPPSARAELAGQASTEVEGMETLTSGPLHEAFAEPVLTDPSDGLVVRKAPPEPIDEQPPEYVPEGENIVWISGYWAWDDEREDYIWISGVYRDIPPGQRWVPGYWHQVADGYQWVPGFWVDARLETLSYQPAPPESLERGPSSPAPGEDYFYTPGYWHYHDTGYRWQAGYWHPSYADWLWIPPRNCWTPRGYVFTNGYWDRRLSRRGFVFAPVYFGQPLYRNVGFHYRPTLVININTVFANLFVRPNYSHYYFGDYYSPRFGHRNIYPAYAWHGQRRGYDPLISFYSSFYGRQGRDFMSWSRDWHGHMLRNESARPPRTWAEARDWQRGRQDLVADITNPRGFVAQKIDDVARLTNLESRFVKLEDSQREAIMERAQAWRELRSQRSEVESGRRVAGRVDPRLDETRTPGEGQGDSEGRADLEGRARAEGRFRLPPAVEARVDARADVRGEDRVGEREPGDRGPGGRADSGRNVPPPANARLEGVREDLRRSPDAADRARPDVPRPDVRRGDDPRPDRPDRPGRPDAPGVDTPQVDTPRPGRPDTPRGDQPGTPRVDTPRPDTPRVETPRPETPRVDTPRPGTPRVDTPRPDTPRVDTPRVETPRPDTPRVETPRPERPRPEIPRPQATPRPEFNPQPSVRPERPQQERRLETRPNPSLRPNVEARPQPRVTPPTARPEVRTPTPRPETRAPVARPQSRPSVPPPQARAPAARPQPQVRAPAARPEVRAQPQRSAPQRSQPQGRPQGRSDRPDRPDRSKGRP